MLGETCARSIAFNSRTVRLKLFNVENNIWDFVEVVIPCIVRRMNVAHAYNFYKANVKFQNQNAAETNTALTLIKKSSFYKLARLLTSGDEKLLTSIDYVIATLVNDTVMTLQKMIDDLFVDPIVQKLGKFVENARNFLKIQYPRHLIAESLHDGEPVPVCHLLNFALNVDFDVTDEHHEAHCNACAFPFFVLDSIKAELNELLVLTTTENESKHDDTESEMLPPKIKQINSALEAIEQIRVKFVLFMGHINRLETQRKAYEAVIKHGRDVCLKESTTRREKGDTASTMTGSLAILTLDMKMKLNSHSNRLSNIRFYSDSGVSWTGGALHVFKCQFPATSDQLDVPNQDTYKQLEENMYCDQIVNGDTTQNTGMAASSLEALIHDIGIMFPEVEKLVVVSDNGSGYGAKEMVHNIIMMNYYSRIKIVRLLRWGTQDGKTDLDGHFGSAYRKLISSLKVTKRNMISEASTEKQVFDCLKRYGGLPNTWVQLIQLDRDLLAKNETEFNEIHNARSNFKIGRFSECIFGLENSILINSNSIKSNHLRLVAILDHSGFGSRKLIGIDFLQKKQTLLATQAPNLYAFDCSDEWNWIGEEDVDESKDEDEDGDKQNGDSKVTDNSDYDSDNEADYDSDNEDDAASDDDDDDNSDDEDDDKSDSDDESDDKSGDEANTISNKPVSRVNKTASERESHVSESEDELENDGLADQSLPLRVTGVVIKQRSNLRTRVDAIQRNKTARRNWQSAQADANLNMTALTIAEKLIVNPNEHIHDAYADIPEYSLAYETLLPNETKKVGWAARENLKWGETYYYAV